MNNLAALKTVEIDEVELLNEWHNQIAHSHSFEWKHRNYVPISFFTEYFQSLLNQIIDEIGLEPKNILLQLHDKRLCDDKWYLKITHRDDDRLTCLTVPLVYSKLEPIRFYDDSYMPVRGQDNKAKPVQTACYSKIHPTLVNVNNLHNVRVVDDGDPRVLLQISYDTHFDKIISKNPDKWLVL